MRLPLLLSLACFCVGCQLTAPPGDTSAPTAWRDLPAAVLASEKALESALRPASFEEPVERPQPEPEPAPAQAATTAASEYEAALTLADLERMALAANPAVSRAAALVEAAKGAWVQAGLPPNPTVGYEGQQVGSGGRAEQDGVFISQEFVRGGKLQLNRNVAAQEIAKAEYELAAQHQRVLTDTRIAYYRVLVARRQAQLAVELKAIATEGVNTAAALFKGQEVGRVDVVQAQLEYENAGISVQNAHNRSRAAWQALTAIVGNPRLAPQPLDGELETDATPRDLSSTLERLLIASPEIAAARAEIERARWAAERARVEKTPNVFVQGMVNYRDNGIGGDPDGEISVGVPVPIWNRNQGAYVQATQQAAAAERALAQVELGLRNRLAPVYERYANALNQVEKYRTRILPAAEESLNLMRRSYEAGETGYINLLTAQRTFSQTHWNYLESLQALREAEAEIDGLLLSGSLEGK